ncbi:MAG: pyrimidine/purine nucleoside phosphorylase [Anaerolineae bacterium]|nr:pyrimidine/purine nucleoside phosphorylase [Anaerolineae bacterium]
MTEYQFEKVTIVKKANIYFDGKVTSRIILFPDGSRKTLGIMLPGEYKFNTDAKEVMEVLDGEITVRFPGSDKWQTFHSGDSFAVPARSSFELKIDNVTDYCCSYE